MNAISMDEYNKSRVDTAYNSTQVPNPFFAFCL
jgi:hypothetical protein